MDIRPLHTDDDYRAALAEVSALVDQEPESGTPEGNRLEILSILIEHYEDAIGTAHLLRSPANAAHLERSITQLRGIIRTPVRPVSVDNMSESVRDTAMTGYNTDFALWAEEQALKLRAGMLTELDRENIAEELESLARALRREVVDRLARLLQNLVQWHFLDGVRLPAWYVAITDERDMIPRILDDAPSLRATLSETFADAWQEARERASGATGLSDRIFPEACPYSPSQALDAAFWPEWNTRQEGPTRLEQLRGSVRRYDNPTGSVWPGDGPEYQESMRAQWDDRDRPKENP
ncbi:DUF29 family protein [Paraburkholderia fynbosensis]|uniref:Uncharacterized protein n=1 Tax=Paraburkholderia fynbosensis TaxID=1200993 RepID=A0A6J5GKH9_9BURK|nr:hypothetical protein LMG27177_04994 [Paraburkholderia fynbosensis]